MSLLNANGHLRGNYLPTQPTASPRPVWDMSLSCCVQNIFKHLETNSSDGMPRLKLFQMGLSV